MKRTVFLLVFTLVAVINLLALPAFAGSDVVVAAIESADGKSLKSLAAGDVVTVRIALPELDGVRKFEIDLKFDESVVEYNGDAALGDFAQEFAIATVAQTTDAGEAQSVIRFVAANLEPLTISGGKNAFIASFTVKDGAPTGDATPFSMENFICDDESVSLYKGLTKITIVGDDTDTTAETTAAEDIGSEEDGFPIYLAAVPVCAVGALICAVAVKKRLGDAQ